jgi:hypothetical protein
MIGGVQVQVGAGNFSPHHHIQTALGPTQPPIQWVPGDLSLGVKWPGHEDDHSPPSSAEVNVWSYAFAAPNTPLWHGAWLKAQEQLYLLPFRSNISCILCKIKSDFICILRNGSYKKICT